MLENWQIIRQMVIPELLGKCGHMNHGNRFVAVLQEEKQGSVTPTIYLVGIPENSILIKPDHEFTIPRYMEAGHGKPFRQRCDYVLLTHLFNRDMIISFELKSTTTHHNSICRQFKGGDCLLDYLAAFSKRFTDSPFTFDVTPGSGIDHRYVLVYVPDKAMKVRSKSYGFQPRPINNDPDHFYSLGVAARRTSSYVIVPCTDLIRR